MNIDYNFILVACIMIAFDIITGVLSSFVTGTFESSKMRKGGIHKLFLLVVLSFGVALDYAQRLVELGIDIPTTEAICGYVAIMEILSCVENINKAYPNALPKKLTNILYSVARDNEIEQ